MKTYKNAAETETFSFEKYLKSQKERERGAIHKVRLTGEQFCPNGNTYKEKHFGLEHHGNGSWGCNWRSTGWNSEAELDIPFQLCCLVRELYRTERQVLNVHTG